MSESTGSVDDAAGEDVPLVKKRRARRQAELRSKARRLRINFSIVGVQKAATSTLYGMLVEHPEVAGGQEKELRFFMREKLNWTTPKYAHYARATDDPQVSLAGDATPAYFFWPRALERMRAYNPDMRLIVSLRDPIERAFSQWSMERAWNEEFPDLYDAIDRFAAPTIPEAVPEDRPASALRKESLFTRGLYGQQLRRGLLHFPREQWLVLDFRDVFARHEETLDRVTDFLGVERFAEHPPVLHRNQTPNDHVGRGATVEQLAHLVEIYAPDLRELTELSGLDVSSWATSRVANGETSVEELTDKLNGKLGLQTP
ncbi:sulfotransferase [Nocardioides sp.]|uniref:sulfotransferase family protein n=1 Tax=Nocardioides sp. TaxID=35761 RepID=UPI00356221BF